MDVVENGIDRAYFEAIRPQRDPNQILYLGALDWRPNLDALGVPPLSWLTLPPGETPYLQREHS